MRRARHIALVIVLSAATAASGAAQSRPYRGLFGGAQPVGTRGQSLDLTLSGFGGWDQSDQSEDLPPQPELTDAAERVELQGPFGGTSATLMYTRPGKKLNLAGYGSGFLGYFPDNQDPWYKSSAAALLANGNFDLGARTRLRLGQNFAWATDFQVGFLTGGTPGSDIPLASGNTGFESAVERAPSISSQSDVSLSHNFTQKSWLEGGYRYRYLFYLEPADPEAQRPNGEDQTASVQYNYRLTQHAAIHSGYAHRRMSSRETNDQDVVFHDIDLGVNYSRSLSFSRKTKFSFTTGSTIAANQEQNSDDTLFNDPRFFVIGGATLTHELGRTWTAYADYGREVTFPDGFAQPTLLDRASLGVGGLLGLRTDLSGGINWTSGAIGLDENNYQSWLGSVQLRTAITRNLAAYGYYYYYLYDFGTSVEVPQGFVRELDRHGVRVGLTTWLPLWASRGTP